MNHTEFLYGNKPFLPPDTHTLAQIRTLRKTKEKDAKAWEKKPAFPSSHSLTFSLIILYLTSCCLQLHSPPSKLPRINKECNVTQSHFWKQRRKISGEETLQMPVFSFSSPPILSFPPLPKDQFHCYSREQHLSQNLPAQLSKRSIV